jgi:DNA-binding NarL/FixJ family response regulator
MRLRTVASLTPSTCAQCFTETNAVSLLVAVTLHLSDRERDVLSLVAEGRSNRAIGKTLFLSPRAVERHVQAIFQKLRLPESEEDNRRVLAVLALLGH